MSGRIERRAAPRPLTVVLRLLPEPGAAGALVGHAEVVATGETVLITGQDDLVDLVRRLSLNSVERGFPLRR
jgi:hypothetical protein